MKCYWEQKKIDAKQAVAARLVRDIFPTLQAAHKAAADLMLGMLEVPLAQKSLFLFKSLTRGGPRQKQLRQVIITELEALQEREKKW